MTQPSYPEGAETARRALRVLELVGASAEPVMLDDLVRQMGLNKSTVYRLVRVLQAESYIEHVDGGGYLSGSQLYLLASNAIPGLDSYSSYLPLLQMLAADAGETSTLHRRVGDRALLVFGADGSHALRRVWTAGELTPISKGAAGLALLSGLSSAELDKVLGTDAANTSVQVRRSVAQARKSGYAMSFGANHPGVHGVATPVPESGLAISVSGPGPRWTKARMAEFVPKLVATTRAYQEALSVDQGAPPS